MDSSAWANDTVLSYWGIVNLIIAIPFLAHWTKKIIDRRKNTIIEVKV